MSQIFDVEAWRAVLVTTLGGLGATLAQFVPKLVAMLVIVGVGWLISKLSEAIARRLLARLGLDRACARLGVSDAIQRVGLMSEPSGLLGRLVFWVLMLTFVLSAVETLGLTAVTQPINQLIAYLPSVIAASLIVVVGLLMARFAGGVVGSGAATAGLGYATELGRAAQGVVVVMVGILAVEQLGVNTELLTTVLVTAIIVMGGGIALALALGSHEIVASILAGHYLRQTLAEGDSVEVDGRRGRVERIGAVATLFRDEQQAWSIPNTQLLRSRMIR